MSCSGEHRLYVEMRFNGEVELIAYYDYYEKVMRVMYPIDAAEPGSPAYCDVNSVDRVYYNGNGLSATTPYEYNDEGKAEIEALIIAAIEGE